MAKKKLNKKEVKEEIKEIKNIETEKCCKLGFLKTSVKIPLISIIICALVLAAAAFVAGIAFMKFKNKISTVSVSSNLNSANVFDATDADKPELDFYVMSFCPYGNQMETTLRPVFNLLGDKVTLRPRYIFEKVQGDLSTYCTKNNPNVANCAAYVKNSNGQLKDINDCKTQIAAMIKTCNDDSKYLKIGNNYYTSLHGRQEATEDVREICAYNLASDKKLWWDFVDNVNANCTAQNADSCWEDQAKKAGLDSNKITECFNKDATSLIEAEIADTTKNNIAGSPTLMIDGQTFPPTISSTAADQNLKIGKEVFALTNVRTSNVIKAAVCTGFKSAPKVCSTEIKEAAAGTAAPATAGCGN